MGITVGGIMPIEWSSWRIGKKDQVPIAFRCLECVDKPSIFLGNREGDGNALLTKMNQHLHLIKDIRQRSPAGTINPQNVLFYKGLDEIRVVDSTSPKEAFHPASEIV